jgi:hypothetical protein
MSTPNSQLPTPNRQPPSEHPYLRATLTGAAVLIVGNASLLACPVCFGAEESSMMDATKLGILALLAITLTVQGGFLGFFLYLRRRAKQIAELDLETEWSDLQRGSRTS